MRRTQVRTHAKPPSEGGFRWARTWARRTMNPPPNGVPGGGARLGVELTRKPLPRRVSMFFHAIMIIICRSVSRNTHPSAEFLSFCDTRPP